MKKIRFKKVVKHNNLWDKAMLIICILGLIIWLTNSFFELNYWNGIWTGIMFVLILYWGEKYCEGREVYYEETK